MKKRVYSLGLKKTLQAGETITKTTYRELDLSNV
jgi:hypothetical protein